MAVYNVKFYNSSSGWYHSTIQVDAVTPGTAEDEARNEFGPDNTYYRVGVEEVAEPPAPADTEEVNANG